MKEQRFYVAGIVLGILGLVCAMFEPVVGLVLELISLILNLKNRGKYRIKAGMVFTIVGLLISIAFLVGIIWLGANISGETDYWFYKILFD